MAYITRYNAKKSSSRLEGILFCVSTENVYKVKVPFLGTTERKELNAYMRFLQHDKEFENLLVLQFETSQEEPNLNADIYIFQNRPVYHSKKTCSLLFSDFENFLLPEKIIRNGTEEIWRFREVAQEIRRIHKRDKEAFKKQLCLKFDLNYPSDILEIFAENSAVEETESYTIEELENQIEEIIEKADTYFNESEKNKIVISYFKDRFSFYSEDLQIKYNKTPYSEIEIRTVLRNQFREFNDPLKRKIREWLRIKFNPSLDFKPELLQQLGYETCPLCTDNL